MCPEELSLDCCLENERVLGHTGRLLVDIHLLDGGVLSLAADSGGFPEGIQRLHCQPARGENGILLAHRELVGTQGLGSQPFFPFASKTLGTNSLSDGEIPDTGAPAQEGFE